MEEKKEEVIEKSKQYLLMADQLHMALFSKLMPGLQFIEVEGIAMKDNKKYNLLANPVPEKEEEKECSKTSS